ncbi:hypothetical protein TRFO_33134 [Tritrichomonas foetus]|uniref:Uncharacterized protein n=1 Tax=Tritrichomonas foetus TaxID=1144522 RepID=A0A1J4JRS9_9EUKA|nr:hypothetical protein TRFO_33134 [Tritrichomonas foetus]|eukprot:OHT00220.1 hypothetical protein TRFO_33134 [Tritrichomonas foetus]
MLFTSFDMNYREKERTDQTIRDNQFVDTLINQKRELYEAADQFIQKHFSKCSNKQLNILRKWIMKNCYTYNKRNDSLKRRSARSRRALILWFGLNLGHLFINKEFLKEAILAMNRSSLYHTSTNIAQDKNVQENSEYLYMEIKSLNSWVDSLSPNHPESDSFVDSPNENLINTEPLNIDFPNKHTSINNSLANPTTDRSKTNENNDEMSDFQIDFGFDCLLKSPALENEEDCEIDPFEFEY